MPATLQNTIQINDQVAVGPQPSEDEIQQLADEQFRAVVNFRTDSEEEQPLSPKAEGEKVRAAGMEYLNIPVAEESLGPDVVDRFRREYGNLPKPVYAHCKTGKRAGAMVMMHIASEQGMTGDETLKKAEQMGFECDKPELIEFVKTYVDEHGGKK
jgi:uncharacterized protein (TIGR01244 family)